MKKTVLIYISVIFLTHVRCQFAEINFPKCCLLGQQIVFRNTSFLCDKIDESNIKILNNFKLANISEHFCVEVFIDNVWVFEKNKNEFAKLFSWSPNYYPKCCPLDYVYHTRFHSCEESESYLQNIFRFRFLRIGLPKCKIILDYNSDGNRAQKLINVKAEDFCIDKTQDNLEVLRICTNDFGVCETTKCIHKCCPDGHSFVNGSRCKPTYSYGVDLNFSEYIDQKDDFGIIHGFTGKIYLQPLDWEFHLDSKGVFRLFDEKIGNEIYGPTEETYCIEHATKNGVDFGHRLFRKHPELQIEYKFIINGYVMVISSIFLLLTIILYILLGETKKLFGKTLVSFCLSLLIAFGLLIYSTFNLEDVKGNDALCRSFGFLLLYVEFSTFLWLKLLCFNIYYTFGSGKIQHRSHKKNSTKQFLLYLLYGWGFSLLLTSIPLCLFYMKDLPVPIEIKIGIYRCAIDRLDGNYAEIVFRTVPITIIQIIIVFLFIKTVKCCMQVKNEIRKMNNRSSQDHNKKQFLGNQERLVLVTKLSIIMGISYVFEVVSSFYDFSQTKPTKYLEILWDIFNCLQGVFIFIIFICKKKMINNIKTHAGVQKLRKISFSSGNTLTTNLSIDKDKKKKTTVAV